MNIYASDPNLFTGEDGKENPKSRCAFLFLKLVGIVQTKKVIQKMCLLTYVLWSIFNLRGRKIETTQKDNFRGAIKLIVVYPVKKLACSK